MISSLRRASAAVAASVAALAAVQQNISARQNLVDEFTRPPQLVCEAGVEVEVVNGATNPCDCSEPLLALNTDLSPLTVWDTIFDSAVSLASGAGFLGGGEERVSTTHGKAFGWVNTEVTPQPQRLLEMALMTNKAQTLLRAIKESGEPVLQQGIVARPCRSSQNSEVGLLGYYQPQEVVWSSFGAVVKRKRTGQIVICSDMVLSYSALSQTITHELVHAYDSTRDDSHLAPCERRACTEVRAYNLTWSESTMERMLAPAALRREKVRNGAEASTYAVRFD
jgi:hypothetical protein